jgi:hypothetical protein
MESKYFGLNTDNLKFYKLGEVFYEFRKFIRRYFAIFSKKYKPKIRIKLSKKILKPIKSRQKNLHKLP